LDIEGRAKLEEAERDWEVLRWDENGPEWLGGKTGGGAVGVARRSGTAEDGMRRWKLRRRRHHLL